MTKQKKQRRTLYMIVLNLRVCINFLKNCCPGVIEQGWPDFLCLRANIKKIHSTTGHTKNRLFPDIELKILPNLSKNKLVQY